MQPQDQRDSSGDDANGRKVVGPEPHRKARDAQDHQPVQRGQRDVHLGDDPHLALEGVAGGLDGFFCVVEFAALMGEELDRMDVGVAVHHAAGDSAAGFA